MFKTPTIVLEKDREICLKHIPNLKKIGKLYRNLKKILLKIVNIGTAPQGKGWVRGLKKCIFEHCFELPLASLTNVI